MDNSFIYDRIVTGRNFIGRKAETDLLRDILSRNQNVSIYEPAKTGKNSLLNQTFYEMQTAGEKFRLAECSLLNVRTVSEFASRLVSTIVGVFATTPSDYESMDLPVGEELSDAQLRNILSLPYRLAEQKGERLIVVLHEFQNILLTEDPDRVLRIYEEIVRKSTPSQRSFCSWVWVGSKVNAMKVIFDQKRYFYRMVERVRLAPISEKDLENHIIKGFLVSGKVIEKPLVHRMCSILQCNIYYMNHFAAICDGLSRGFIMEQVVEESLNTMLAIHEPRFVSEMNDLTTYQIYLLKAVLDGESMFSSADVIARYGLNSSANVRRLKDALCKKEIITFNEDGRATVLDPLFEYWMRRFYFTTPDICDAR